ncbi:2-oxoglutarate-dependent dioxygenase 11 [Setaria viridis]|uniref:2-oxoglutarate-dependent dioxygenase 11 n=1 Tax=Setaria viridis TaxID=4556 RepID=UPI003B3BA41E
MEVASEKIVNRDEITDTALSLFAGDDSIHIPESYIRTDEVLADEVVGKDEAYELPAWLCVPTLGFLSGLFLASRTTLPCGAICLLPLYTTFALTNHGVDEAVAQLIKDSTVEFFSLPLDIKNRVAVLGKGAGLEGYGHHYSRGPGDKLDWAEGLILITQPVHERNMKLWPTNPPTFRDALATYSVEMTKLARRLLGFMAADIGDDKGELVEAFTGKRQSMAMHYYPPCRHPDKVMGITPHTDGLGLTLLLHVDDTPGLQIKKDGRWYPVRPLPGAILINIGDVLDVLTNGAYTSVEHRVIPDAERGRTTVVFVEEGTVGEMVTPLPGLLKEQEPRYKSLDIDDYIKGILKAIPERTRFADTLKI